MANSSITNPSDVAAANIIYANKAIEALQLLAPKIDGFTTNLTDDFAEPGDKVTVAYVAPGTVATSFTSYLTGTLAKKKVEIELDSEIYIGYPITESDMMDYNPAHWEGQAERDMKAVIAKIVGDAAAVATGAKATQSLQITKAGELDLATIGKIRKECIAKNIPVDQATLYLNPTEYTAALNLLTWSITGSGDAIRTGVVPQLFGFKAVIEVPNLTSPGFVSAKTGVAIASRAIPTTASGIFLDRRTIKDETTGLLLTLTSAGDVTDGKLVHSIRAPKGEVIADPKAIIKLTNAPAA